MKRGIILVLMLAGLVGAGLAEGAEQTYDYNIRYHFGPIHKMIAKGVLKLDSDGNSISATLNGQSVPWGGRVYTVADTLKADISYRANGTPRQKETYRNGWYSKPTEAQLQKGWRLTSNPANYKTIQGAGTLSASHDTMMAVSITTDMLGLFYIFQKMDFAAMEPGAQVDIPVQLPDDGLEHCNLTYEGASEYEGKACYKVKFEFTYDGTNSGYPVTVEIDRATRVPLLLQADLIIGHMEMIYQ